MLKSALLNPYPFPARLFLTWILHNKNNPVMIRVAIPAPIPVLESTKMIVPTNSQIVKTMKFNTLNLTTFS